METQTETALNESTAITPTPHHESNAVLARAAAAADQAAANAVFSGYCEQLAPNTRIAQDQDLARCVLYLADIGVPVGALALDPAAWSAFSWGLVEGFKRWMLREGYAIATMNRSLATVKAYVQLAAQAGAVGSEQAQLIAAVKGYGRKQARPLDADRAMTRRGTKKSQAVSLSLAHARALKAQPGDTAQGRRDALLC